MNKKTNKKDFISSKDALFKYEVVIQEAVKDLERLVGVVQTKEIKSESFSRAANLIFSINAALSIYDRHKERLETPLILKHFLEECKLYIDSNSSTYCYSVQVTESVPTVSLACIAAALVNTATVNLETFKEILVIIRTDDELDDGERYPCKILEDPRLKNSQIYFGALTFLFMLKVTTDLKSEEISLYEFNVQVTE